MTKKLYSADTPEVRALDITYRRVIRDIYKIVESTKDIAADSGCDGYHCTAPDVVMELNKIKWPKWLKKED